MVGLAMLKLDCAIFPAKAVAAVCPKGELSGVLFKNAPFRNLLACSNFRFDAVDALSYPRARQSSEHHRKRTSLQSRGHDQDHPGGFHHTRS